MVPVQPRQSAPYIAAQPRQSAPYIAAQPAPYVAAQPTPAPESPVISDFAEPEEHTVSALAYATHEAAAHGGPVASEDPAIQARLASLAGLSLDRSSLPAPSPVATRAVSSKVPWVLLAVFLVGGTLYHVHTVRELRAEIGDAKAAAPAGSAGDSRPTMPHSSAGLLASGYVAAKVPIVLGATSSGRMLELKVDNGDTISKGQVVAVLDDSAIRAELNLAGARLHDAQRAANRMRMLAKAQAATAVDLEKALGQVEVASAEVHVVQQKLEQTRVRSPINGTVLEVLAHPGESVVVGPAGASGILRIADLSALRAEVDVAEAELKNVLVGQDAEVTTESLPGRTFHAIVREIAEQADRARGTVLVKVDIIPGAPSADSTTAADAAPAGSDSKDATATGLKPGMAVQVRFLPKPLPTN